MKRALPAYVYAKGKRGYLYFCRGGSTIRIHAAPGTPDFAREYAVLLQGRAPAPKGKTFRDLIASYRRSHRFTKLAPRTAADYDGILAEIEKNLGGKRPDAVKRVHVVTWRDERAETVRFANYLVQVLRVLFEHGLDVGMVEENPAKGVPLLVSGHPPRGPWPQDMVAAYRAKASGTALLLFELCLGTGQRIGDVLRMRWNDIEAGGINVKQGKTGETLWVPMSSQLRTALEGTPKRGMTIAARQDGRPLSYRMASDYIMGIRRKIGAEAYDIHALRHTTASVLAELDCSDELIAAVTGHKSARMVQLYTAKARQKARAKQVQKHMDRNENGT